MDFSYKRKILHVDVNCAFLAWEALHRLNQGSDVDLREIASAVGGNPETRRGIILAKSQLAKNAGVITGEPLRSAFEKCPQLVMVQPTYGLYSQQSRAMTEILKTYTPAVQKVSIDECFLDISHIAFLPKDPAETAFQIKERIRTELGFTVSVGVSSNKLLAKMGSELRKPDYVTTLFPHEIEEKLWPLPVGELHMVGKASLSKLAMMGIYTIGDLARSNQELLKKRLGKYGDMIWQYANGIEDSEILENHVDRVKGIGNSTTLPKDLVDREALLLHILSLTETVAARLRADQRQCGLVSVTLRNTRFETVSHQKKLNYRTDSTDAIYTEVIQLFDALWKKDAIRLVGVRVGELDESATEQLSFFAPEKQQVSKKLDQTIDSLRERFGSTSVMRACFLNSGVKPINGRVGDDDDQDAVGLGGPR